MMPSVKINLTTKLKRSEKMSVGISLGVNLPGSCSFSLKSEKADKHREVLPRRESSWVLGECETGRCLHQRRPSGLSASAASVDQPRAGTCVPSATTTLFSYDLAGQKKRSTCS